MRIKGPLPSELKYAEAPKKPSEEKKPKSEKKAILYLAFFLSFAVLPWKEKGPNHGKFSLRLKIYFLFHRKRAN